MIETRSRRGSDKPDNQLRSLNTYTRRYEPGMCDVKFVIEMLQAEVNVVHFTPGEGQGLRCGLGSSSEHAVAYLQFGGIVLLGENAQGRIFLNGASHLQHLHRNQIHCYGAAMRKVAGYVENPAYGRRPKVKAGLREPRKPSYQLPLPQPRSTHVLCSPGDSASTSLSGGGYLPITSLNMACCWSRAGVGM